MKRAEPKHHDDDDAREALFEAGLEVSAGAALLLDEDLRVRLATPSARRALGFDVPLGARAPKLLCGDAPKRPVAEAMAKGEPVEALLPRPDDGGLPFLKVRAVPLAPSSSGRRSGFLVLVAQVGASEASGPVLFQGMWTSCPRMKEVFRVIERVADSDAPVLVRGETGAGKELVAEAVHALSSRRQGPFRAINCAALPANLLESELFGHAKGAFTGAVREVPGFMQLADQGTLFLDEVAELPLELQAKLLRVVETHTVIPVGAREPIPINVRIVSATHRALRKEVAAGRFRADLMFRLRVIPIFLPPLRERPGDIGLLCDKFMAQMNRANRRVIAEVSPAALAILERYEFPGNVRELKNILAYAYAIGEGPILKPSDLPPELSDPGLEAGEQASPEVGATGAVGAAAHGDPEARRILAALERAAGSRDRAAKSLGLSRVTLWRRMRALGLTFR